MSEKIRNLEEYMKYMESLKGEQEYMLFRGECKDYGQTACQPNIFRKGYLDKNEYFEKNILDEMTANRLAEGNSYIEKAINAQHGGFASRLLDVSYNCLSALYFAITPFYTQPEESMDGVDGCVFVFFANELFCPTSSGIMEKYEAIIKKDREWYTNTFLFNRNFKVIDHVKLNSRIIAQQGAFILFPGDEAERIPPSVYKKIVIDGNSKKKLRKDLKKLFGIDTGTMYPEVNNCVDSITEKSKNTNSNEFTIKNELEMTLRTIEREIEIFTMEIMKSKDKESTIRSCETRLLWYKKGYEQMKSSINESGQEKRDVINFSVKFDACVNDFYSWSQKYVKEDFEFCRKDTLIGENNDESK